MMRALAALLPVMIAFLVGAVPALAWTWPAEGPVVEQFEIAADPYAGGQHRGIDVAASAGSAVLAPAGGTIAFAGSVPGGGRTVTIETADGYAVTLLHLGAVTAVEGDAVAEGAPVAAAGRSGAAEQLEPYVHLGIRIASEPDGYVDPLSLLPARAGSIGEAVHTGSAPADPVADGGTAAGGDTGPVVALPAQAAGASLDLGQSDPQAEGGPVAPVGAVVLEPVDPVGAPGPPAPPVPAAVGPLAAALSVRPVTAVAVTLGPAPPVPLGSGVPAPVTGVPGTVESSAPAAVSVGDEAGHAAPSSVRASPAHEGPAGPDATASGIVRDGTARPADAGVGSDAVGGGSTQARAPRAREEGRHPARPGREGALNRTPARPGERARPAAPGLLIGRESSAPRGNPQASAATPNAEYQRDAFGDALPSPAWIAACLLLVGLAVVLGRRPSGGEAGTSIDARAATPEAGEGIRPGAAARITPKSADVAFARLRAARPPVRGGPERHPRASRRLSRRYASL